MKENVTYKTNKNGTVADVSVFAMCLGKITANLEFYALLKYVQAYIHIHDTQGLRVYLSQKRNYFRRKLKLKAKNGFHR